MDLENYLYNLRARRFSGNSFYTWLYIVLTENWESNIFVQIMIKNFISMESGIQKTVMLCKTISIAN